MNHMKNILLVMLLLSGFAAQAQISNSDAALASSYFKEAEAGAKTHRLWPVSLYGPTMFVDLDTRAAYANVQESAGVLKPVGDIYAGVLPADVMIANTTIVWSGR